MKKTSLGERIAIVRGDVRQEDFAKRFGISRKTLIRYENDERTPGADFLQALIIELGVDATWLIIGEGKPPTPELTPREAALLANYRGSSEKAKRNLETTSALLAEPAELDGEEGKKAG